MLKKLREPVNSLTHWGGAILALAGLIALLIVGWGAPAKVVSLVIYGISLVFLFSASATYHMARAKDKMPFHFVAVLGVAL
jgi:hemolysin III